jgi:hypothetical protein
LLRVAASSKIIALREAGFEAIYVDVAQGHQDQQLRPEKRINTYFCSFWLRADSIPRISKAFQKPSRHSARLGAFLGKALRGV